MDATAVLESPFTWLVGWSVLLLAVHIALQAMAATLELGSAWNAGPRDEELKPSGIMAGRAARASANFQETYPAFVGLALALAIAGDPSGWGATGAFVWFSCRIIYILLYLAGVSYVRSLIWLGAVAGLLMMFLALVF